MFARTAMYVNTKREPDTCCTIRFTAVAITDVPVVKVQRRGHGTNGADYSIFISLWNVGMTKIAYK
jgi:hypothetical protein